MRLVQGALEDAYAYWKGLCFDDVCRLMCSKHYPLPRWKMSDAQQCALLYKRFLWLTVKYGADGLVPTKEVDEFWHNHILDTKRYVEDCYQLMGGYIHHVPSDLDSEDLALLAKQFKYTNNLYLQEFNEPIEFFIEK